MVCYLGTSWPTRIKNTWSFWKPQRGRGHSQVYAICIDLWFVNVYRNICTKLCTNILFSLLNNMITSNWNLFSNTWRILYCWHCHLAERVKFDKQVFYAFHKGKPRMLFDPEEVGIDSYQITKLSHNDLVQCWVG